MAWIGVVIDAVLKVLKSIFGTDKPATTEVVNAMPDKPLRRIDDDPALLRDLGVHGDNAGASDSDGVRDSARRSSNAGPEEH